MNQNGSESGTKTHMLKRIVAGVKKRFSAFVGKAGVFLTYIYTAVYTASYITGAHTMRFVRAVLRRTKKITIPVWRFVYKCLDFVLLRHVVKLGRGILAECVRFAKGFSLIPRYVGQAFGRGTLSGMGAVALVPFRAVRRHRRALFSIFNVAAPVAAAFVLVGTLGNWVNMDFALVVEYNGNTIGYVSDEAVYDQGAKMAAGSVINTDNSFTVQKSPTFSIALVNRAELMTEAEIRDRILESSDSEITQASGLYIGGYFEAAVESREALDAILDGILEGYRTGAKNETVEFVKDVQIVDGLYPVSTMISAQALKQRLTANQNEERTYEVVSGDTISGIAKRFEMTQDQLRSVNTNIESLMYPGKMVTIETACPYLQVQIRRTIEYTEVIGYSTEKVQNKNHYIGYERVTKEGKNGEKKITAEVTLLNGLETSRTVIKTAVTKEPVTKVITVGAKKVNASSTIGDGVSTGRFVWPLPSCKTVSSGFGRRWGRLHAGIDISGNGVYGKDIIAADGGRVAEAGYHSGGYGYYVLIDHGGGYKTMYAHCSSLLVKAGQKVTQGQLIAKAGSSGNSTGAHLHFEVRINGSAVDPMKYLSR